MALTDDAIAEALAGTFHYADPRQQIAFGSASHYLQYWRGYLEVAPASVLVNGAGVECDTTIPAGPLSAMLGRHGIRNVRIEAGWEFQSWDGSGYTGGLDAFCAAMHSEGVRTLILLNGNEGIPCPNQGVPSFTVTSAAAAGQNQIVVDHPEYFTPFKTGIDNFSTAYRMADCLVIGVSGNTLTLSRNLKDSIPANSVMSAAGTTINGTEYTWHTLKYAPFTALGQPFYHETLTGFLDYAKEALAAASGPSGAKTAGSGDLGVDLDVWNELSFGSAFLSLANYFDAGIACPYAVTESVALLTAMINALAQDAIDNEGLYEGVNIDFGGSNQTPEPAAGALANRIAAMSKHPYVSAAHSVAPGADILDGTKLDALGQSTSFTPTYSLMMPETGASNLLTECVLRDASPVPDHSFDYTTPGTIKGHGRYVRGTDNPCWLRITEDALNPADGGISDFQQSLSIKQKAFLRNCCLFLNKGASLYSWFQIGPAGGTNNLAGDGVNNIGFGLLLDSFIAQSNEPGYLYPSDDAEITSPALTAWGRLSEKASDGLDESAGWNETTLKVLSVKGGGTVWAGDGTANNPDFLDRDCFAFLPFQVSASKLSMLCYVMTRDVRVDYAEQQFALVVQGLRSGAAFSAYDPVTDSAVAVEASWDDSLSAHVVQIGVVDYPRILTADVAPSDLARLSMIGEPFMTQMNGIVNAGTTFSTAHQVSASFGNSMVANVAGTGPQGLQFASAGSGNPPEPFDFPANSSFTVDAWIYPTANKTLNILYGNNYTSNAIWCCLDGSGHIGFQLRGVNTPGTPVYSTATVSLNAWHHTRFVYNYNSATPASSTTSIYLDGVLVVTQAGAYSGPDPSGTQNMLGPQGNFNYCYQGYMDEVAIFAKALATGGTLNGAAVFTPPTAPYANNTPYLQHVYHMEGDGTDSVVAGATGITLTGASAAYVGTAIPLTVALTPPGVGTPGAVITPSDGSDGTFSPTTLTLSGATTSGVFQYTPNSAGNKTVSISNNGGLDNPSTLAVAATVETFAEALAAVGLYPKPGPGPGAAAQAATLSAEETSTVTISAGTKGLEAGQIVPVQHGDVSYSVVVGTPISLPVDVAQILRDGGYIS